MRWTPCLLAAGLFAASGCAGSDAPVTDELVTIGSELACASCTIAFETVATIDTFAFQGPASLLARDSAGRIYVVDAGVLAVYSPEGRFVHKIGRKGAGPGEYSASRNVLVGADGLIHVLDGGLGRVSRYTASGESRVRLER